MSKRCANQQRRISDPRSKMGSNLNGKASTCLLMQGLALSPFLGSFIDKQQGGSVRGITGLHRAEAML